MSILKERNLPKNKAIEINKETCISWLLNKNITYFTEEDFGKTVEDLKPEEPIVESDSYEIIVTEELVTSVKIKADSEQEAIAKAQAMYDEEKIVLDWSDISEVKFRSE